MVDVLMATYNGGKYIENQLLSLIGQTFQDWILYIHDDGSTDETIQIVKKYQKIDARVLLIEDGITFGNAGLNFLHLLQFSAAQFTVFCDQDDIWLEHKLEELHSYLQHREEEICGVFCNGYAYSREKGILGDRVTAVVPKNLKEQLFLNAGIQGCSLMFTKATREQLGKIPKVVAMHDHFITLGIIAFGTLDYLDKNLMLYRQFHENKATSNIQFSKWERLKSVFFSEIPVVDRKHWEATESFFEIYGNDLSPEAQKLFLAYLNFGKSSSFIEKMSIILKNGFSIYGNVWALPLKVLLRKSIN